ncbi:MAG: helix-turn-helix transcriptional regulator [Proteobacteria bacterium]|nr:helix-turn-helix transcriptional regulator [Pseudomonadota bacterium]
MTLSAFIAQDLPWLLDLLYGAALDEEQWPVFLQGLMKPFDGANGVLHFFDIETQTTPIAYTFGLEADYLASYQEHFSNRNPYPVQTFEKLPILQVRPAIAVLSKDEALRTEFYNDWMRPQGITPDHLGCTAYNDGHTMVVLAVAPSERNLASNVERYTQQLELLAPHLKRAVALSRVSRPPYARMALPAEFSCGAMLISESRAVKSINLHAEMVLKEGRLLTIDPLGKLRVREPEGQAAFMVAVDSVFHRQAPIGGPVHCRPPLGDGGVSIVVLRLPAVDPRRALVLLLPKPGGPVDLTGAQFTAAETRLAKALLTGQALSDFCDQTGISINTARKQLAALFAKTGTNRQAALVAWLLQRKA